MEPTSGLRVIKSSKSQRLTSLELSNGQINRGLLSRGQLSDLVPETDQPDASNNYSRLCSKYKGWFTICRIATSRATCREPASSELRDATRYIVNQP